MKSNDFLPQFGDRYRLPDNQVSSQTFPVKVPQVRYDSADITPAEQIKARISDIDRTLKKYYEFQQRFEAEKKFYEKQLRDLTNLPPAGTTVQGRSGKIGEPVRNWTGRNAAGNPQGGGTIDY